MLNFRQDASRTAASVGDIHRHAGGAERSHPQSTAVVGRSVFPHSLDMISFFTLVVKSLKKSAELIMNVFILVTHGGRRHEKFFAHEESTNHAQTPVASTMEIVPGNYRSF